jgi:hypothetical protein
MNNTDQLFCIGELLLRLQMLQTAKERGALFEIECSASAERREVAVLACFWLGAGKSSPLKKRLKITITR